MWGERTGGASDERRSGWNVAETNIQGRLPLNKELGHIMKWISLDLHVK